MTGDAVAGLPDVAHAVGDGHSTAGTLGIGPGAILRQASWCGLSVWIGRAAGCGCRGHG
jgi:hypothetical protein